MWPWYLPAVVKLGVAGRCDLRAAQIAVCLEAGLPVPLLLSPPQESCHTEKSYFSTHSLIPLINNTLFSTHYMPGRGLGARDSLGVKPDASQSVGPGWREEDAQYTGVW